MTAPTTPALSKIVTFALGEDLFAADIFSVERVLRYQPPRAIPNVPAWIEGVIEYQGRVVPVINLRSRFEMPANEVHGGTRILVFQAEGEWIGAVVDAVVEVTPMEKGAMSPPPPLFRGLAGQYLIGILRRKERLVIVLDVAQLLSSNERLVLEQVKDEVAHG